MLGTLVPLELDKNIPFDVKRIFHYIKEEKINNILMTSILCLPSNKKLREEILILAKKNGVNLHFGLENKINTNFSIDNLNTYYETILEADKRI